MVKKIFSLFIWITALTCNSLYAQFIHYLKENELLANKFSLIAKNMYLNYSDSNLQTNWHQDLYTSYLKAIGITDQGQIEQKIQALKNHRNSLPYYEKEYSAEYLLAHGMDRKFLDHMAVEYAKMKPNTYIIVLFPPVSTNKQKALQVLDEFGIRVYQKTIRLSQKGFYNLITMLYEIHHNTGWLKETDQVHARFKHILHSPQLKTVEVLLWECETWPKSVDCKRKLRAQYHSNEACHFNDHRNETIYHAQSLFHDPTIEFLNHSEQQRMKLTNAKLREFQDYIKTHKELYDEYSIDAGRVLDAYGIRLSADVDIVIKDANKIHFPNLGINNATREKFGFVIDDMIYNPEQFFYHKGLRFVSLDSVTEYKKRKAKEKDQKDLLLIRKFKEKHAF